MKDLLMLANLRAVSLVRSSTAINVPMNRLFRMAPNNTIPGVFLRNRQTFSTSNSLPQISSEQILTRGLFSKTLRIGMAKERELVDIAENLRKIILRSEDFAKKFNFTEGAKDEIVLRNVTTFVKLHNKLKLEDLEVLTKLDEKIEETMQRFIDENRVQLEQREQSNEKDKTSGGCGRSKHC